MASVVHEKETLQAVVDAVVDDVILGTTKLPPPPPVTTRAPPSPKPSDVCWGNNRGTCTYKYMDCPPNWHRCPQYDSSCKVPTNHCCCKNRVPARDIVGGKGRIIFFLIEYDKRNYISSSKCIILFIALEPFKSLFIPTCFTMSRGY